MRLAAPYLLHRDPGGRRVLLELPEDEARVTIGRRPSCDVALPWDDEVSRLHAVIARLGAEWIVADEGLSRNGTFVNGERVRGRRRLRPGDTISVGASIIAFCAADSSVPADTRAPRAAAEAAVDLTPAQRRVLDALVRPLRAHQQATPATNRAIAEELSLSIETVKGTLSALFERFGLAALPQNEKRAALAHRVLSDDRFA